MITLETILLPQAIVASRVLDGEAVLVHPLHGKVKVLNEVGAFIWQALDGRSSAARIAAAVCTRFDVDVRTAETDVLRFLESLRERDLVVFADPQPE